MGRSFAWKSCITAATLVTSSFLNTGCAWFAPSELQAKAQMLPALGRTVRGHVTFVERADGVQITYNIAGLRPTTEHALQIHEWGNCNAAGARSTGRIFALNHAKQMRTSKKPNPEGRLPNIRADLNGVATGFFVIPDLALAGTRSIIGRSIVVLRKADDPRAATPVSGSRLACGVIRP